MKDFLLNDQSAMHCRCSDCPEAEKGKCNSTRLRELVNHVFANSSGINVLPVLFCRQAEAAPSHRLFKEAVCLCTDCCLSPGGLFYCKASRLPELLDDDH